MTYNNNASALDMQDLESTTSTKPAASQSQRRGSQASRRFSAQSVRPLKSAPSNSSVPSMGSQEGQDGSSPGRNIRQRLSSMAHRSAEAATSFTSPLAQIYQPLIVDDDIAEEESEPSPNGQQNIVSYGPAMRRRLSSMHRFPPMPPMDMQRRLNSSRGQNRDGHILDVPMLEESPRSAENITSIKDEEEQGQGVKSPPPEPVSQVLGGEGSSGMVPQVNDRLTRIEERQKRLEDLILQLSQDIRSGKH